MTARIYRPAKTAMQSGTAKTERWVLEYVPAKARAIDPVMGWTSSSDMQSQVKISFDTLEEAEAYAERKGIQASVKAHTPRKRILKTYADNFK